MAPPIEASRALDPCATSLGISTSDPSPDHYTLLGLQRFTDDRHLIEQQYRRRCQQVKKYAIGAFADQSQQLLTQLARAMLCLTDRRRKAAYDEKLGRVASVPSSADETLEDVFLSWNVIGPDEFARAKELAKYQDISLPAAVCRLGFATEAAVWRALAHAEGLAFVELDKLTVDPALLKLVPNSLAHENQVFPVAVDHNELIVACSDPYKLSFEEPLRFITGMTIRIALAPPSVLRNAISHSYTQTLPVPIGWGTAGRPHAANGDNSNPLHRVAEVLLWTALEKLLTFWWLSLMLLVALLIAALLM